MFKSELGIFIKTSEKDGTTLLVYILIHINTYIMLYT